MKRFVSLCLAFFLFSSSAFGEATIDFKQYSDEGLLSALSSLYREMSIRRIVMSSAYPKGSFKVGEDIPAGVYIVSPMNVTKTITNIYVNDEISPIYGEAVVTLYDGDLVEIKHTPLVFRTYYHAYIEEPARMSLDDADASDSLPYDPLEYAEHPYRTLFRYSDKYKGEKIKIMGEVVQVIEGLSNSYRLRLATADYGDDVFYVYISSEIAPDYKILEGDTLTVYGIYSGEYTYTSTLDKTITIPSMEAEHIHLYE